MLRWGALLSLLGLLAATLLIAWSGYDAVLQALKTAGWGILGTSLFHLVPMLCSAMGWRALMPGRKRPTLAHMTYILWLRAAVNNLMPVARIGGEVVAVRVMMKQGIRKTSAIASTVVELTLSVIAMFLFDIVGIGLFTLHVAETGVIWKLFAGVLLAMPAIGGMIIVQRIGFFGLLDRVFRLMIRDKWKHLAGSAAQLDRAVHIMYRRKKRVLVCGWLQLTSWVLGTGEIALALFVLGHPLSLVECLMIEALIQATASAAFVVPGALGVQEAGFLLFGHMLGLTNDIAAALALVRRCRDLIVYVPGLIAWQAQEGKWLFHRRHHRQP